jgi:hypothetical protein
MTTKKYPTLVLNIETDKTRRLATLLQRGFLIPISGAVSLYDLLSDLPGFDHDYITNRIETIFINGCAGDSLEQLLVPGNTVALSAAMPGLAGAIFRKGGAHASLRSKPVPANHPQTKTSGFITLKLFNMTATDTVGPLLEHGILIKGPILARFFKSRREPLQTLLTHIRQGDSSLSVDEAILLAESRPELFVKGQSR